MISRDILILIFVQIADKIFSPKFFPFSTRKMSEKENPIVFFDISIGNQPAGRMKMELFADVVPKTAENFR